MRRRRRDHRRDQSAAMVVDGVAQRPPAPFPHRARTSGRESFTRPFWPSIFTIAWCLPRQRLVLFSSSDLLPPGIFRTNFETGASGTLAKVVRSPPVFLSVSI
jgi:hypothetical protein